jgi:hypothetical protein
VLWIGGAQWSAKSSVAQLLTAGYGMIHYVFDYHDARSNADGTRDQPNRFPHHADWLAALGRNPGDVWVETGAGRDGCQRHARFWRQSVA